MAAVRFSGLLLAAYSGVALAHTVTASVSSKAKAASTLSSSQAAFEAFALDGGEFSLRWKIPARGGVLVSPAAYMVATATTLNASPAAAGSQLATSAAASLNPALSVPAPTQWRVLKDGQIWSAAEPSQVLVSYAGDAVRKTYLAADGKTVLQSTRTSVVQRVPLQGVMAAAPQQVQSFLPLANWASSQNLSATAQWLPSSAYLRTQEHADTDVIEVEDCNAREPTRSGVPLPCATGETLTGIFPFRFQRPGQPHPGEIDSFDDGTIVTQQGVRMWVATAPIGPLNPGHRVFFELNGNVYNGSLIKSGTTFRHRQADGTWSDYKISYNAAAIASLKNAFTVNGVATDGAGRSGIAPDLPDMYGLGAMGVNGALGPADLRRQYDVPADLSGAGQTIAVVGNPTSDPVYEDLNAASEHYGLPQLLRCDATPSGSPCFRHLDAATRATGNPPRDWGKELTLDVQAIHAVAPRASILLVTGTDRADTLAVAAAYPGVTAVTWSGDLGTRADQRIEKVFKRFPRVAFFMSSGDNGHENGYLGDSAYVTVVGGTRIAGFPWRSTDSEVAWQHTGGGEAQSSAPSWQQRYFAAAMPQLGGSHRRAAPDVAAVADAHYSPFAVYHLQQWTMEGGTSLSSPVWAGFAALWAEQLARNNQSLADLMERASSGGGGFNAILYAVKQSPGGLAAFRDVLQGSNNVSAAPCPICAAGPGYNYVTGLGVPDVSKLVAQDIGSLFPVR